MSTYPLANKLIPQFKLSTGKCNEKKSLSSEKTSQMKEDDPSDSEFLRYTKAIRISPSIMKSNNTSMSDSWSVSTPPLEKSSHNSSGYQKSGDRRISATLESPRSPSSSVGTWRCRMEISNGHSDNSIHRSEIHFFPDNLLNGRDTIASRVSKQRQASPMNTKEYLTNSPQQAVLPVGERLMSPTMFEVYPGVFVPLRGAAETRRAIECSRVRPCRCHGCQLILFCIEDAGYVVCPDCYSTSPLNGTNNLCVDSAKAGAAGGVGLGFKKYEIDAVHKQRIEL